MPNLWERRSRGLSKALLLCCCGSFLSGQALITDPLSLTSIRELRFDSEKPFALTAQGFFSRDPASGEWLRVPIPAALGQLRSVSPDPRSSQLLVASSNGLWSTAADSAPRRLSGGLPESLRPLRLERSASRPDRVYLSEASRGLFRSDDGGQNWRSINQGLPRGIGEASSSRFLTLRCSPHDADALLVGGEFGGLFRSVDGGKTWRVADGLPAQAPRRIPPVIPIFHPQDPRRAWAVVTSADHSSGLKRRLYQSLDRGRTWHPVLDLAPLGYRDAVVLDDRGRRLEFLLDSGEAVSLELPSAALSALPDPVTAQTSGSSQQDQDLGEIAVLIDDGGLTRLFNLDGRSLLFTPNSAGGYSVELGEVAVDTEVGDEVDLAAPRAAVVLGFDFEFFGQSFDSIFVGESGQILLDSTADRFRPTVAEFLNGGFRALAPMWGGFQSELGGQIFLKIDSEAEKAVVTWAQVAAPDQGGLNTFQAVLEGDGSVTFVYAEMALGVTGLVGLTPGNQTGGLSVDFSLGFPVNGPAGLGVYQDFVPDIDVQAAARRFYQSHADVFDILVFFASSDYQASLGGGQPAFHSIVRNQTQGTGRRLLTDNGITTGSAARLQSLINMNSLSFWPQDPTTPLPFDPVSNTLTTLAHQVGHRHLAFVQVRVDGLCSNVALGRQLSHWSFFLETDASVMEGNHWLDNRDGSFSTIETTDRFSPLDLYLLGWVPAQEVPDFFVFDELTDDGGVTGVTPPRLGVTVRGTPRVFSVADVISCEGPRSPSVGPDQLDIGFVLLVPQGVPINPADVARLDDIRVQWVSFFEGIIQQRAQIDTSVSDAQLSDIEISVAEGADPIVVGRRVLFQVNVLNHGPRAARDVEVDDALAEGFVLDSAIPLDEGSCALMAGVLDCQLGNLAPGQSKRIEIEATPQNAGFFTQMLNTRTGSIDLRSDNDSLAVETLVLASDNSLVFPASLGAVDPRLQDAFVGIAIMNDQAPDNVVAAFGRDGMGQVKVQNLVQAAAPLNGQLARLASELTSQVEGVESVQVHGALAPLKGFFLVGDDDLRRQDGLGEELLDLTDFFLPFAQQNQETSTVVQLFNPDPDQTASAGIELFDAQGVSRGQTSVQVASLGVRASNLEALFGPLSLDRGYLRVISDRPLRAFELISTEDVISAAAARTPEPASLMWVPHYVVDSAGSTTLIRILNSGSETVQVTVEAFLGLQGSVGSTAVSILPAHQAEVDLSQVIAPQVVADAAPGAVSGFLSIRLSQASGSPTVLATATFRTAGNTESNLPVTAGGGSAESFFLQVADSPDFNIFTGLAIFNPDARNASVTVEVFDAGGQLSASKSFLLTSQTRLVDLLSGETYFGAGFRQIGGHFRVRSSRPVIVMALFGDFTQTFLSAIAAQ